MPQPRAHRTPWAADLTAWPARCTAHLRRVPPRRPATCADAGPAGALHSEYVVSDGHGGSRTKLTQTGTVDEVTPSSSSYRSDDGYTQIYAFPSAAAAANQSVAAERHRHRRCHPDRRDGDPQPHRRRVTARQLNRLQVLRPESVRLLGRDRWRPRSTSRVSAGRLLDCACLTQLISGPETTVAEPLSSLSAAVSVPIATTALAPMAADANLIFFEFIVFTSDHSISVSVTSAQRDRHRPLRPTG